MSDTRSYKIDKFASNLEREVNRLEGQLELFWENKIAYYRSCGLSNGMSVLLDNVQKKKLLRLELKIP